MSQPAVACSWQLRPSDDDDDCDVIQVVHGQKKMRVYGGDVAASCHDAQRLHAAYIHYSATAGRPAGIAFLMLGALGCRYGRC